MNNYNIPRRLYPFRSHFLDINGFKYHYIDEGKGEPVVMIHGNPTWSFFFRRLIKELSPQFRAIAPDHIGCGFSEKPDQKRYDYRLKSRVRDLKTFIDKLKLKNISIVVHDWGGAIGMAYAVMHPENINRIVIMNTAAFLPPSKKKLPIRLSIIRDLRLFSTIAVLGFNLFSYAALYMAPSKPLSRDVKRAFTAPYNCWKNRIATLMFVRDIPFSEKDPSFNTVRFVDENLYRLAEKSMLICWGCRDFVFDSSYLEIWQKRFPKAIVHKFKDAGHYLLEDEPNRICRIIKEFLQ